MPKILFLDHQEAEKLQNQKWNMFCWTRCKSNTVQYNSNKVEYKSNTVHYMYNKVQFKSNTVKYKSNKV